MGNIAIYISFALLLVSGGVYCVLYVLGNPSKIGFLELLIYLFFACVNIGYGIELIILVLMAAKSPHAEFLYTYWFGLSTGGLAMLAVGGGILTKLLGIDSWLERFRR